MSVLYLTYKAEEFKYLLGASSSGSKLDHHRQESPSKNPQELFFYSLSSTRYLVCDLTFKSSTCTSTVFDNWKGEKNVILLSSSKAIVLDHGTFPSILLTSYVNTEGHCWVSLGRTSKGLAVLSVFVPRSFIHSSATVLLYLRSSPYVIVSPYIQNLAWV